MLYLGIAVAVVSGLLIGFVTLSVIWTAKTVGKNIQERSLDLLSTYDELLENRSRELSALDVELENRKKELEDQPEENGDEQTAAKAEEPTGDPVAFLRAAEQLSTTPYQDSGAGETYQRIRQTFAAITDEAVRKLVEQSRAEPETGAGALLKDLPFDTVYQLSTLPADEQLRLLREVVPTSSRAVLERYAASAPLFDSIAFYDALKAAAAAETGTARLRVAPQDIKLYPASLDVTVDEDICEGFQVEMDNVLYDYAIKTREIG